ncbi:FecR family protein [Niastella sp. OAS944]|uniref:FecR family protein n=1 Tax=Niastella sp. OAS944 TaxID=2664089 RepID=UPI003472D2D5|nr:ferric-dicitrate binding protein FerR (iron transport regulator) [Chitinophagaceae bacterium OAS944]
MATNRHIAELIIKHRKNSLSAYEKEELETWCDHSEENQLLFDRLSGPGYDNMVELYNSLATTENNVAVWQPQRKRVVVAMVYMSIIICLLFAGMAVYSVFSKQRDRNKRNTLVQQKPTDVINNTQVPDVRRVQLKLASGDMIYLDSSVNGHVALQYRSVIFKRGDMIRYEWSTGDAQTELEYNTLITPPARRFMLELPDGSKAWLNASSSITYPTAFIGKERTVQVTGEVYFEVNHYPGTLGSHEKKPFIVYVNSMPGSMGVGARVEVLGTHFNVNAYDDELVIKTTLLQGKLKVSNQLLQIAGADRIVNEPQLKIEDEPALKTVVLTPGQQAQVSGNGKLEVIKYADIQETMAWHKGLLIFNDRPIKQIMKQLARQYDFDVAFNDEVDGHYTLTLTQEAPLDQVLQVLEFSGGVHFKVDGRKIVVSQ